MFFYFRFLFIVVLIGCENPTQQSSENTSDTLSGKLIITGSSTVAPLASELAKKFEDLHKQVKVDVQTGGSSRGIADVRRQVSDIGMVSRKLKAAENDLTPHLLAIDGVSIIVNAKNPVLELTAQQIRDIYLKKIVNWQSINGVDKEITVINKAEGRSTLEVFTKHFQLKNRDIKPDVIIGDNEQGIKLVANNPNAIAYVSIGAAEYSVQHGVNVKALPLNGVPANTQNLAEKRFPLSRELNFVTLGEVSPLSEAFLHFSRSSQIKPIVEEYGFVALLSR